MTEQEKLTALRKQITIHDKPLSGYTEEEVLTEAQKLVELMVRRGPRCSELVPPSEAELEHIEALVCLLGLFIALTGRTENDRGKALLSEEGGKVAVNY